MRAVRFHEYGDPEVLTVEDAPEPHAGPGQIRIRVQAASVNAIDWKLRAGHLQEVMPVTFPAIPGQDAAGVVDQVGDGVTDTKPGELVFGLAHGGTAAELAVLTAWAPVPSGWTPEQAAAAGLVSSTASAALNAVGDVAGKTVLVEGAAGGVGSAAVEIALARGAAAVVGTATEVHHDFLRSLGAAPITYGEGLADRVAAAAPQGADVAVDFAGSGSLAELVAITGDPSKVSTSADFKAAALGVTMAIGAANAQANFAAAAELGAAGTYTPRVQATYPLEQAADAHAHVQNGHTEGKVVITL